MTIANVAVRMEPACQTGLSAVRTTRFGDLEVDAELVIEMQEGLIGFERLRRFVVVTPDESSPFRWFQSLDDGSIAFPIIDPWQFKPDYGPTISETDSRQLGLSRDTPRLVFAVVTIPKQNPHGMTANLLGPIVVNAATRRGRQVIVTNEQYTTRHSIVEEMRRGKG